jgi:hypothetical protein
MSLIELVVLPSCRVEILTDTSDWYPFVTTLVTRTRSFHYTCEML